MNGDLYTPLAWKHRLRNSLNVTPIHRKVGAIFVKRKPERQLVKTVKHTFQNALAWPIKYQMRDVIGVNEPRRKELDVDVVRRSRRIM
ncbi:hypothetical protein JYU34_012920, partial [Plutella xylostella]